MATPHERLVARALRRTRREGSVAIMSVFLIVIMLGTAALVIDVGQTFKVRSELQNVADAAALAAAQRLNGTSTGIAAAKGVIQTFGQAHVAEHQAMNFSTDMTVEFGRWYFAGSTGPACSPTPCFVSYGSSPATPSLATAVRVTALRTAAAGNAVDHFFAPLLGKQSSDAKADAVAVGGGPAEVNCAFPLVVPDCQIQKAATDGTCGWCMTFAAAPSDTAGWTTFSDNNCGGPKIDANVAGACGAAGEYVQNGQCTTCNAKHTVNEQVKVCNGNDMNKNNFCGTILKILQREGVDANADGVVDGKAFKVRAPVLQTNLSAANCGSFSFSGYQTVSGFASMTVYGARCGNGKKDVPVVDPAYAGATCQPPPNGDVVIAQLDCNQTDVQLAGGGAFGVDAVRVRLVE
jgi:Flp pilus assembly protein TadG